MGFAFDITRYLMRFKVVKYMVYALGLLIVMAFNPLLGLPYIVITILILFVNRYYC